MFFNTKGIINNIIPIITPDTVLKTEYPERALIPKGIKAFEIISGYLRHTEILKDDGTIIRLHPTESPGPFF